MKSKQNLCPQINKIRRYNISKIVLIKPNSTTNGININRGKVFHLTLGDDVVPIDEKEVTRTGK